VRAVGTFGSLVGRRFRSTAGNGDATRAAPVRHLRACWFLRPPIFLQVLILIVVEVPCFQRALEVFISRSLPPAIYSVLAGRVAALGAAFNA